jgi:hypothetical protein
MGVLDDAIREHLELKRRHGAPEAELSSKEREALGASPHALSPAPPAAKDAAQPQAEEPAPAVEEAVSPEPEPEPETEDVLEETPEFLQETPEHDRLWFEQKPPRDFDFDE